MSDQQFDKDAAAAHKLTTQLKRDTAMAAAHTARAARPYTVQAELTPTAKTGLVAAVVIALVAALTPIINPPTTTPPPTTTTVATTTTTAPPVSGARPFAATSPWNTPIPAGTQWFDTPVLHTPVSATDTVRHYYVNELSMRIWQATPLDPKCTYQLPAFVDLTFNRNRPATTVLFPCPDAMQPGTDEDHILFISDTNGDYVELWQATRTGQTITALGWARGNMRTGTGMGSLVANGGNNGGVRAANFSWAAGLITGSDIEANKIDHALVLALGWGLLSNTAWRDPATAPDNGGHSGPIEMGTRLGIPAGTPRPAGLSPLGNAMFDALVKYGAYVGDFAGSPYPMFYVDSGTVQEADPRVRRLFTWWESHTADMDLLSPLIRVADYQPGG